MLGRMARTPFIAFALLASGCTPELGDVPFACEQGGLCPAGYSCQATVCVRDGANPGARRPRRVAWINPPEMYWHAAEGGGASLIYNDGFTPGAKGIYEIAVSPDGAVSDPRPLFTYRDAGAISSSILALPDGRYGMVLARFPNVEGDDTTLELFAIERATESGKTPAVEKLFSASTPFLGGVEPPYIGAVVDGTTVIVSWGVPSDGGRVEVLHIERQGSLYSPTWIASTSLPPEVPPLSGDCQLFRGDDGFLTVRVGFESYAISRVDPAAAMGGVGSMTPFLSTPDEPLFGWKEGSLALRRGDFDPIAKTYAARYAFVDPAGGVVEEDSGFVLPGSTTPFVGTPFEGGALIAPVSRDPDMPTVDVAWRSPSSPLRIVASVPRDSSGVLYSARAFGRGDKAFVAWTEFYESSMDLWIGVSDLAREGAKPLLGSFGARAARGATWRMTPPHVAEPEGRGTP